ncbi:hypothetical protein F2P81_014317 [Scophthalmus maximus]|uniref:Uncharacterized protein n=1 Tax=Scophthalmus maximus TaxID=52904 RepID=A0A6A4ST90_SCOMX|nr:hypothetical protein F2P81_014317 [Scophthalmus maximus]
MRALLPRLCRSGNNCANDLICIGERCSNKAAAVISETSVDSRLDSDFQDPAHRASFVVTHRSRRDVEERETPLTFHAVNAKAAEKDYKACRNYQQSVKTVKTRHV